MATIASTASGNWTATGTWSGGAVPGTGDTATINHQITLDANASVGGITPASTGTLLASTGGAQYRLLVGSGQVCFAAKGLSV